VIIKTEFAYTAAA